MTSRKDAGAAWAKGVEAMGGVSPANEGVALKRLEPAGTKGLVDEQAGFLNELAGTSLMVGAATALRFFRGPQLGDCP